MAKKARKSVNTLRIHFAKSSDVPGKVFSVVIFIENMTFKIPKTLYNVKLWNFFNQINEHSTIFLYGKCKYNYYRSLNFTLIS